MKLTAVYAAMPNYEFKLNDVLKIITDIFNEMDFGEIETINLAVNKLPFYDGLAASSVAKIAQSLEESNAIIFATTANCFSMNSLMHTFLEHLFNKEYKNAVKNKHCLIAITSGMGGEKYAADMISGVISQLQGYESGRIMIGSQYLGTLQDNREFVTIIERQAEDFYRIIRQNRKFFIPSVSVEGPDAGKKSKPRKTQPAVNQGSGIVDGQKKAASKKQTEPQYNPIDKELEIALSKMPQPENFPNLNIPLSASKPALKADVPPEHKFDQYIDDPQDQELDTLLSDETIEVLLGEERKPRHRTQDLYVKESSLSVANTREQEQDIEEISKFYLKKYIKNAGNDALIAKGQKAMDIDYSSHSPRKKTCRQMTQSLPRYFRPLLDTDGFAAVFQLNILGANDGFEGYLVVEENQCAYYDGQAPRVDITIIADTKAWNNILLGKNTVQKAFMIGQAKVRGNFLLLSKFDQMFSFGNM